MTGNRESLRERLGLYVVTDERSDAESLVATVRAAVAGGAMSVQLRRKHEDGGRFVEIGLALRGITRDLEALFFVNDRVDVAILTDADGVHVGQSDISCLDAKKLMGDKFVGVSVATLEQARQAERDGADYLGVGSIYPTTSKADVDMCRLDELERIAKATQIPLVAIGGITVERTVEVLRHGAHGVAVVSAVMHAQNPQLSAADFVRIIGCARARPPRS